MFPPFNAQIFVTFKYVCWICGAEQSLEYAFTTIHKELPARIVPTTWHCIDERLICDKHVLKVDDKIDFYGMEPR